MEKFKFGQRVQSDDYCILGKVDGDWKEDDPKSKEDNFIDHLQKNQLHR